MRKLKSWVSTGSYLHEFSGEYYPLPALIWQRKPTSKQLAKAYAGFEDVDSHLSQVFAVEV